MVHNSLSKGVIIMTLIEKFLTTVINLESMSIAQHNEKIMEWHYDSTPENAIIFATTGVDGCHYCVVPKQGYSIDESPIYYVSPMDWEDTVVWVAKDFVDFLSLGVALGSFTYTSDCHSCERDEFLEFIEESWAEADAEKKLNSIKLLEEYFPLKKYDDFYEHITASYKDTNNHVDLSFEITDIINITLGHYDRV